PEPDLQPEPGPQPELKSKPEPEPPEQVPLKPAMEQKPRPMPSLWTHAVSMPDDWSLVGLLDEEDEEVEESEGTRNKAFTQKLHKGLQERKNQTKERRSREQAPIQRYWPRAFAFCIVLILVLTGAWAVLRYLQKNIHPRGDDGLSHPVQTDVGTKNPPAALPGALSASVPAVLLSPDEKPAKPAEESVPVKPAPKKTELPAEKPASVEKPAKPQENPVPVSHPVSSEDKPMPPVKPAPKKPVPPAEKPASVEKPAKPAEKPVSVEKPAKPVEKPVSVEKPAKPVEKPAPVKKQTEPVLPVSYEGQVRQGTAALNNKRYDEALETFSQALERRKDDPRAWLGIVAAFEGKGAVGEAFRVLVDARNALPRNPTIEVKLRDLQQRNK
ncbi:MAG: hypothetical protein K5841_01365, partial [Fretibacterium sp.]|nr:hypothetical protein [Fretibacterium sp.]